MTIDTQQIIFTILRTNIKFHNYFNQFIQVGLCTKMYVLNVIKNKLKRVNVYSNPYILNAYISDGSNKWNLYRFLYFPYTWWLFFWLVILSATRSPLFNSVAYLTSTDDDLNEKNIINDMKVFLVLMSLMCWDYIII